MSQETKKQHFLPFAYVKYFRCDQKIESREKARIFRDDGKSIVEESAAKQCYKKWFYRRHNTIESEDGFQTLEKDWNEVIRRARKGEEESSLLFFQMVMYHFRNLSIRMLTSHLDRYQAVQNAVISFVEQKILRLTKGVKFTDDPKHVTQFPWQVKLVVMDSPMLFTSDNPSIMTITNISKEEYGPFLLPISPTELLVAVDKKKYKFKHHIGTKHDAYIANAFVAAQAVRHIYLHKKIDAKERTDLWKFIKKNKPAENARGTFENNRFRPGHPFYGQHKFRFLEEV